MQPSLQRKKAQILWTVAGFDPSSGAGVTADLMTFAAHGAFGCSAITALTVQNTLGVYGTQPVDTGILQATLDRLAEDLPPAGVKIGMLGGVEAAATVAAFLRTRRDHRRVVVLDPVLRSSSGRELYPEAGLDVLRHELLPEVDWITPNHAELAVLTGHPVRDLDEAETAGRRLTETYPGLNLVVTGGDLETQPTDLVLLRDGRRLLFQGQHVDTTSTHGTGCAFSSTLLCRLVAGFDPTEAVAQAKHFVEGALRKAPGLGAGRGPMELLWPLLDPDLQSEI